MSTLQPIQIDEHTVIYVEAETTAVPERSPVMVTNGSVPAAEEGQTRTAKGGLMSRTPQDEVMLARVQTLENTIRCYTSYMLNAFKKVAIAEVKSVTLEFGVNMSGMSGIPYIASGTAGCNVKVQVECVFPNPAGDTNKDA